MICRKRLHPCDGDDNNDEAGNTAQVFAHPLLEQEGHKACRRWQARVKNRAVNCLGGEKPGRPQLCNHTPVGSAGGIPRSKKQTVVLPIYDSKGVMKFQCLAVSMHLVLFKKCTYEYVT